MFHLAELHDVLKGGRQFGMPLDDFTNQAYEGLAAGKEEVPVDSSKEWYNKFEGLRQEAFHDMIELQNGRK